MFSVMFGVIACLLSFCINTFLSARLDISYKVFISLVAPTVEEIFKAVPVTLVVLGLKKGTRSSISNAFSVGVGFCVVENFFYLFENIAEADISWVCARCVSTGLMHSMSAVIIGLGIIYARNNNRAKLLGVLISLITATFYHGLYNFLVETPSLIVLGAVIPAITFTVIFFFEKSGKYRKILSDTKSQDISRNYKS